MKAKTEESIALGLRLKEARNRTGLNQAEFAEKIGVARDTISRAEVGAQSPTEKLLRKITEIHGIDFVWLLTGDTSSREKEEYDKLKEDYEKLERTYSEQKATIAALEKTITVLAQQLRGSSNDERGS